jgi:DNA polymerase I-like protein with 3'-5' exonuclease and polymerase domains
LEGDGLTPTKIHCVTFHTTKGIYSTTDYDEMRRLFQGADRLVGHNIIRFDIPVVERILGIKVKAQLVDTLALSWYLQPKRNRHGLESYGEDFNIPKPVVDDWSDQPIEVYVHRCEEDVRINTHLWNAQWKKLCKIYESEKEVWRFVDYLSSKMYQTRLQEESGWKIDIEFTKEQLEKLEKLQEEKTKRLEEIMPRIPVMVKKTKPKVLTKKDGTPSAHGQAWTNLLQEKNLPADTEEVEVLKGYDPPNPNSPVQVKQWLFSLGWVPTEFKHKDGREIPQINLPNGKGICPGIKRLYEKHPELEVIEGLSVLNHRIPILRGFLETNENGYVKAQVQGLTNTLRFQHSHPCVNLPRSDRPFAEGIRGALTAPEGYELCGADMSSLEDRLKQHFIFPLDPKYVESLNKEGYDPHLDLAMMAGMLTQQQVDDYKSKKDLSTKPIRDIAKNGNYACQYGAYPPRLSITCGISIEKAQELFDGYWKLNWSIQEVAKRQRVKTLEDGDMWLFNPLSGFWYSLRKDNDRFSTLIQGTASYVFDLWVNRILRHRPQLTAQFHDEIVLTVKEGYREEIEKFLRKCIKETNDELKLNRQLDIGVQFGDRYAGIH